jgi:hypothetical protein
MTKLFLLHFFPTSFLAIEHCGTDEQQSTALLQNWKMHQVIHRLEFLSPPQTLWLAFLHPHFELTLLSSLHLSISIFTAEYRIPEETVDLISVSWLRPHQTSHECRQRREP